MKTLHIQTIPTDSTAHPSTHNWENPINDHYHEFTVPKIPSYEFRVVEWVNDKGEIVKVGLQSREYIHNVWGSSENPEPPWIDVERVRLPDCA